MRKWYPIFLVSVVIGMSIIAYPRLPARVPIHWNLRGQIDRYGPKGVAVFLFPIIVIGLWGLFRVIPRIDPRRENFAKMRDAYDLVVNAVLTVLAAMHVAIVVAASGSPMLIPRLMPVLMGGLLVVIGNVLPRARPNWFFGIRTPWTLSNDRVWERTHRVGGYLMVGAGLVTMLSVLLPLPASIPVVAIAAMAAGVGSAVYSYVAWKQETSLGEPSK